MNIVNDDVNVTHMGRRGKMFSIDDRAGNVVTTVALFLIAAAILYLARVAFLILLASILFAHLLEPAVTAVELHSRLGRGNRNWAIGQVYLLGTLVVGALGYGFGSRVVAQLKNFKSALPDILHGLVTGQVVSRLEVEHGLSVVQQLQIHDWLARHQDFIGDMLRRGGGFTAQVAASAAWLLLIPVLAMFMLRDGRQMGDEILKAVEQQGQRTSFGTILRHVDETLAKFMRAQLLLAVLSFAFYSSALLILRFPYAVPLAIIGGVLEFLPAVGWVTSAAIILTIGALVHAHWIWMAVLIVAWRLVQDYVNSPRIMGRSLQLPPLVVLVAFMIGGQVGGIAGIYLSVPIVAVLRTVWLDYIAIRDSSITLPTEGTQRSSAAAP
jgi:predicted PurR-regulated permease PerM